jgi:hypothetical protein
MFDLDIPIPEKYHHSKYDFAGMPIGASFAVSIKKSKTAQVAASQYKSRHPGWDYASRTVTEDGVAKYRIWRTK